MTALHDLQVKAVDVLNAYEMAPNREKKLIVLHSEFGDYAAKSVIIVRVLASVKSAGVSFRVHLAQCMQELRCKSCDANPSLWMKSEFRPDNKLEHYSYILCTVFASIMFQIMY